MAQPRIGQKVIVDVPSTTANLGPGFDCLGAALDLNNRFTITIDDVRNVARQVLEHRIILNFKAEAENIKPLEIIDRLVEEIKENCETNNIIEELNQLFWPGPLTIVLKRKKTSNLSSLASAGLNTLAVRIPDNNIALKLIDNLKKPIAAPSANKSGLLSPTEASHVYNYFRNDKNLSIILDGGPTIIGVESTVVKIDNGKIYILRHGGISLEELKDKTSYKIFDSEKKKDKSIISPGMLSQHHGHPLWKRASAWG